MSTTYTADDQEAADDTSAPARPSVLRSPGSVLYALGVLIVLVAYVVAMIGLEASVPAAANSTSLTNRGIAFAALGMFSTLCAFVLAFVAAAKSDRF